MPIRTRLAQVSPTPAASASILVLLLMLSTFAHVAEAVPLFTAQAGPGGVQQGCGGAIDQQNNSPVPVGASHVCSDNIGATGANAAAGFGFVGARTNAVTFSAITVPRQTEASATFTDTLVFSQTDPNLPGQFNVSLNLNLSGILNAAAPTGSAGAGVELDVSFLGVHVLDFNFNPVDGLTIVQSNFGGTGTIAPGGAGFDSLLTTVTALASVGDIPFSMTLFTSVGAVGHSSSALADFSDTLEFPTGIDVFNLPDGYTVNAGTYLVNNRFVQPNVNGPSVPEPHTLALLLAAFLALMIQRGSRRI